MGSQDQTESRMAQRQHPVPTGIEAVTGPPKLGPPIPGTLPAPGAGLKGQQKFDALVNSMPFGFRGHDFNSWLLTVKDDPTDPEFNAILQRAKEKAKSEEPAGTPSVAPAPENLNRFQKQGEGENLNKFNVPSNVPAPKPEPAGPGGVYRAHEKSEYRKEWQQPTFKGAPVNPDEYYGQGEDDFLKQFRTNEGIQLTGNDKALALRSGNYVYMGTEHSDEVNANRDVFFYVEDANNAIVDLGPKVLAEYQAKLKNPVTGKTDKDLDALWKQAVLDASKYAARGQKVTVRELMDLYVAASASGSSGGGGGAAALEDIDYYRAMMQVLGDISGVGNA